MKVIKNVSYTFVPSARTLDLSNISGFDIKQLYAVINTTTSAVIYAMGQTGAGYSSISGSVVTFQYDTTSMNATDKLAIIYDDLTVAQPVTGPLTDTQLRASAVPVSASALPLPAGAATETTVAAISTKSPIGAAAKAASRPVTIATDQTPLADVTASGTITTQNLVPAGTATAGSAVEISVNSVATLTFQVVGTYTGALSLQGTVDGTNWITFGGTPILNINTGSLLASVTSALQSTFQADVAGFNKVRITALAAVTGTATLTLRATTAPSLISIDSALPTGANTIGAVTIASGTVTTVTTVTTVGTVTTLANGQTAHSSPSSGSPVRIGGRVNTAVDTTLANGDASDLFMTTAGQAVIKAFATSELDWQNFQTLTTNTAAAAKAAGAASVRNYVTAVTVQNTNATATTFLILDGASTLFQVSLPASMTLPISIVFPTPLRGTAATALNVNCGTTGANVLVNIQGYQSF